MNLDFVPAPPVNFIALGGLFTLVQYMRRASKRKPPHAFTIHINTIVGVVKGSRTFPRRSCIPITRTPISASSPQTRVAEGSHGLLLRKTGAQSWQVSLTYHPAPDTSWPLALPPLAHNSALVWWALELNWTNSDSLRR